MERQARPFTPLQDHGLSVLCKRGGANCEADTPPTPLRNRDFLALPGIAVGYSNASSASLGSPRRAPPTKIPVRSKSLKKFTLFTNLLPELQLQIWDIAALQPRIIELTKLIDDQDEPNLYEEQEAQGLLFSKTTFPALFHVCIDARTAICRAFEIESERINFEAIPKQLIINWRHDTIFFSNGSLKDSLLELGEEKCGKIRSLAVTQDWWCTFLMQWKPEKTGELSKWFTALEEVVIIATESNPPTLRNSAPTYVWKTAGKERFDAAWVKRSKSLAKRWKYYPSTWSTPLRAWPALNYAVRRRTYMLLNPPEPGEDEMKQIKIIDRNIRVVRGVTTTGQSSDTEFGQKAVAFAAGGEESFPGGGLCEDCLRENIKAHIKSMKDRERERQRILRGV